MQVPCLMYVETAHLQCVDDKEAEKVGSNLDMDFAAHRKPKNGTLKDVKEDNAS